MTRHYVRRFGVKTKEGMPSRRKRNTESPRRDTFSRPGLKNRVDLRIRPRARYTEMRIRMRSFRNLPRENENSFNTRDERRDFFALFTATLLRIMRFINYNPLLIARETKSSALDRDTLEARKMFASGESESWKRIVDDHVEREIFSHSAHHFFVIRGSPHYGGYSLHFSSNDAGLSR